MLPTLTLALAILVESTPPPPPTTAADIKPVLALPTLPAFAGAEDASCADGGTGRLCYFHTTATRDAVTAHFRTYAATHGWADKDTLVAEVEDDCVLLFSQPPLFLRVDIVTNPLTGGDDVFIRLAPESTAPKSDTRKKK